MNSVAYDMVLTALGSPVRRQILVHLIDGNLSVKSIKELFDVTGPAVLFHLRLMHDAGLIQRNGSGRYLRYALVKGRLREAFEAFLSVVDPG
jgi:DNA-binding transcriptional ArsR family regulator